jgi:hypothetical protein
MSHDRAARAATQVKAGQVDKAMEAVVGLLRGSEEDCEILYSCACAYLLASDRSADRKQEYADRAMNLLQNAVKAGYTLTRKVKNDPDLGPLRSRDEFKKLVDGLI